jgi:hypothetical protein
MNDDNVGQMRYGADGTILICTVSGSPGVWKTVNTTLYQNYPMVSSMPPSSAMWPWFQPDPSLMVSGMMFPQGEATEIKSSSVGKAIEIDEEQAKRESEKLLTGLATRKVVPKGGNGK